MIWKSRAWITLQIISREALHKHRAAQSSRSWWLLYQKLTNANSVGREGDCCRDWPGNSQGPVTVRTKSMGSQRKYLIQAGSWGGPFNLIVTETSDFRLKEFCAASAGLMRVLWFLPLLWHDKLHLLLFAVYKENVKEWCKNLWAVILILMAADICHGSWHLSGPWMLSGVLQPVSCSISGVWLPVPKDSCILVQWCHFGQTVGKELWEASIGPPFLALWDAFRLRLLLQAVALEVSVSWLFMPRSQNPLLKTEDN